MKFRLPLLLSLLMLAAAIFIKLSDFGIMHMVRLKVFDSFAAGHPRTYQPMPVRIIDIDDESLSRLGQWPWPRNMLAELVTKLSEAGAAAIVMDIVFAEPDRTSPAQMTKLLPPQLLKNLPDNDKIFTSVIAKSRTVTGFTLSDKPNAAKPATKAGFAFAGEGYQDFLAPFPGAVVNLPTLENAATGNGALNSLPEQDGIVRQMPMLYLHNGQPVPSLTAEALRVAQGASTYLVKAAHGITDIKIGELTVPTDANGRFWIHFTPYAAERYLPAWKILSGTADKTLLDGNIVLIGTSAAGLKDLRATPLNPASSGVEVHAQAIEQVLLGHYLHRPDWVEGLEVLWMALIGLVLIVVMEMLSAVWGALFTAIMMCGTIWICWVMFVHYLYLIEPLTPSLTILMIYLTSSLSRYIHSERERRQVRHAFSRYMSPALVERLAAHPEQLKLGGERRNMSFLFTDIRDFTTISESLDAEALTQFINQFLTPMTEIILRHNGTIDKYMGDAIMAFWNAPLPNPGHPEDACRAALEMVFELGLLNSKGAFSNVFQKHIRIGIGVNSGDCSVGNMGSEQRFDYSVIGDSVNLASRLEGLCKFYGVSIIIGSATRKNIPQFAVLEIDRVRVKGKSAPTTIYALMGDEVFEQQPFFQKLHRDFSAMLEFYRQQQWEDAVQALVRCREIEDVNLALSVKTLFNVYEKRIQELRLEVLPKNWDGIYKAPAAK